jgi:hypothetical protein
LAGVAGGSWLVLMAAGSGLAGAGGGSAAGAGALSFAAEAAGAAAWRVEYCGVIGAGAT